MKILTPKNQLSPLFFINIDELHVGICEKSYSYYSENKRKKDLLLKITSQHHSLPQKLLILPVFKKQPLKIGFMVSLDEFLPDHDEMFFCLKFTIENRAKIDKVTKQQGIEYGKYELYTDQELTGQSDKIQQVINETLRLLKILYPSSIYPSSEKISVYSESLYTLQEYLMALASDITRNDIFYKAMPASLKKECIETTNSLDRIMLLKYFLQEEVNKQGQLLQEKKKKLEQYKSCDNMDNVNGFLVISIRPYEFRCLLLLNQSTRIIISSELVNQFNLAKINKGNSIVLIPFDIDDMGDWVGSDNLNRIGVVVRFNNIVRRNDLIEIDVTSQKLVSVDNIYTKKNSLIFAKVYNLLEKKEVNIKKLKFLVDRNIELLNEYSKLKGNYYFFSDKETYIHHDKSIDYLAYAKKWCYFAMYSSAFLSPILMNMILDGADIEEKFASLNFWLSTEIKHLENESKNFINNLKIEETYEAPSSEYLPYLYKEFVDFEKLLCLDGSHKISIEVQKQRVVYKILQQTSDQTISKDILVIIGKSYNQECPIAIQGKVNSGYINNINNAKLDITTLKRVRIIDIVRYQDGLYAKTQDIYERWNEQEVMQASLLYKEIIELNYNYQNDRRLLDYFSSNLPTYKAEIDGKEESFLENASFLALRELWNHYPEDKLNKIISETTINRLKLLKLYLTGEDLDSLESTGYDQSYRNQDNINPKLCLVVNNIKPKKSGLTEEKDDCF